MKQHRLNQANAMKQYAENMLSLINAAEFDKPCQSVILSDAKELTDVSESKIQKLVIDEKIAIGIEEHKKQSNVVEANSNEFEPVDIEEPSLDIPSLDIPSLNSGF